MKITGQSIEWLGDEEVRITTTRSKGGRGFGFARIGAFGVGGKTRKKQAETTDIIGMERERYEHDRERIENGQFRAYDSEKFYRYEDTVEAKRKKQMKRWKARFNQWRGRRRDAKRKRRRERQAEMKLSKVANTPPRTPWFWATIASVGYWLLMILLTGAIVGGSISYWVLSVGWVLSWVLLPVALYQDHKEAVAYAPNWFPNVRLYMIGSLVPYANVFVGCLYLYRRWKYGRENDFRDNETTDPENQPPA